MLSEDAFTQRVAEEGLPAPHWDDALVGDVFISFVNRLLRRGMLTLSLGCRSQVGIFFVRKKSGRLLMIVNGRQGNQRMRPPPKTSMPSAVAFSELRLEQGEKLRVSTFDIQDCFYQFKIPKAFGEMFGFKRTRCRGSSCSPSHRSSTSSTTSRCQRRRSWPPMRIYVQERSGR